MKIIIELEFDEQELGVGWFNEDNFKTLIYSHECLKPELELLKINKFKGVV